MHTVFRAIAWFLMNVLSRTHVIGKEKLKNNARENVVYVCNHQSIPDAFIMFYLLPKNTFFMAKKEWFDNKIFAWALSRVQVFPINRQTVDLKAIRFACSKLKEGNNLCIFPQGTRKSEPVVKIEDMHNGVGMIAMKNNSTVIPMMFSSKPAIFKRNELIIGDPIDLSEFALKKPNAETMAEFTAKTAASMNMLLEKN